MSATIRSETGGGVLTLRLEGRLDAASTGAVWREAITAVEAGRGGVVVDGAKIEYCDGVGVGLLVELLRRGAELRGLPADVERLLEPFRKLDFAAPREEPAPSAVEQVGGASVALWRDLLEQIAYVGEVLAALGSAVRHPGRVRWRDTFAALEAAGVQALPIIALVGFLIGLIMAFQSAMPLKQFGAELFVANLVGISLVRELGPLMTAIVLAGRSGAAFAAEIGTMKVNEEVNALTTMGLSPVRFLVVPRVLAAVVATPLLTVFTIAAGLLGGAVVFRSMGFPLVTYTSQLQSAMTATDLAGGLVKAFAFGVLVAGIGCLRGLQTRSGASSVGRSATSAVVSGLVLIIVCDGVFSVLYYILGV
jgi:phospholipid/cholesterol/gamma-HCH transport system permease protein